MRDSDGGWLVLTVLGFTGKSYTRFQGFIKSVLMETIIGSGMIFAIAVFTNILQIGMVECMTLRQVKRSGYSA